MIQSASGSASLMRVPEALPASRYVLGAVSHPVSVSMAAFATCVGVVGAGVLGALIVAVMLVVVAGSAARSRRVQRALDRHAEARRAQSRESARMRMLKPTGPSRQQQYGELRDLVGEIARTAPADASRFDLQGLLDHFVRLAVEHQRCVESLRLATGLDGPRALLLESPHARHRRDIRERRLRHRDECMQRIGWLTDELEAIEELVRLVAQRAAYPTFDPEADGELERRLWELDEVDAALGQLSA